MLMGHITGKDMVWVSIADCNIDMLFHSYTLSPHMLVCENVAFSLRIRNWHKRISSVSAMKRVSVN